MSRKNDFMCGFLLVIDQTSNPWIELVHELNEI